MRGTALSPIPLLPDSSPLLFQLGRLCILELRALYSNVACGFPLYYPTYRFPEKHLKIYY